MKARKSYVLDVRAYRDGKWWMYEIPALTSPSPQGDGRTIVAMGQTRSARAIDLESRDLAAVWLDVDEADVEVRVTLELPRDTAELWADANAREASAREAVAAAAKLRKDAVHSLLEHGMSKSDAALALGLSTQRISQLSS